MAELSFPLDNGYTDAATFLSFLAPMLSGSGVWSANALTVAPQSPTPDMTLNVYGSNDALNMAVFVTTTGAVYVGKNTATKPVTILGNTSGVTKTDTIVAYVDLAGGVNNVATPNNPGSLKFIVVRRSSTNTGPATDGEINSVTSSNPWIKLATALVINNATAVSSVTDVRTRTINVLSPGTINLGYTSDTAGQGSITTETDLTALTVNVTVPLGGRSIKITGQTIPSSTASGDLVRMSIKEGSTVLNVGQVALPSSGLASTIQASAIVMPSAGIHTYKLSMARLSGSGTVANNASSTLPSFILAELI